MENIREAIRLYNELNTYLGAVYRAMNVPGSYHERFKIKDGNVMFGGIAEWSGWATLYTFPIEVLEQGVDASVAWYKEEEIRKQVEQWAKETQEKEQQEKQKIEQEYRTYLKLKEKYEVNNENCS